jgi:formylmethanofuran dehydrogenase subunit C
MTGGLIRVAADAGARVGANLAGEKNGLQGGVILVGGSLGAEAGARLRRGLIAARGDAGPLAGWEMRAGTLLVMGRLGPNPGLDQRRGSLVAGGCAGLLPGYSRDCTDAFTWLRLYGQRLAALGWTAAPAWCRERFTRYTGHATGIGKGEVLIYADAE